MNDHQIPTDQTGASDEAFLVVDQPRFALVPEWVIDAKIPDSSFRLYSLLLRYGATSGARMPSRATLARRMQRSTDAIDRAMKGLVEAGIVTVERRRNGTQNLTNRYYLRSQPPAAAAAQAADGGGRTSAATPDQELTPAVQSGAEGGRTSAATPGRESAATPGRTSAGRVAADLRPDRESSTDSKVLPPPPTPSPTGPVVTSGESRQATAETVAGSGQTVAPATGQERRKEEGLATEWLKAECGIEDLAGLTAQCVQARQTIGKPTGRWAQHCLVAALQLAVRGRGWPADQTVTALLTVAADPKTISPMRLAEAGPWWDLAGGNNTTSSTAPTHTTGFRTASQGSTPHRPSGRTTGTGVEKLSPAELVHLEARLVETDGERIDLQFRARKELSAEGIPVTRATVTRRACQILDRRGPTR